MKKSLSTFILLSILCITNAQIDTNSWKHTLPRHDMQVSIGAPSLFSSIIAVGGFFNNNYAPSPDEWFDNYTYKGMIFTTGSLSLAYKYRITKWFWIGATASYTGFFENDKDQITDQIVGGNRCHVISIMPSIRFSWLNKPIVTIYSGLGVGAILFYNKYEEKANDIPMETTETYICPGFQLTAVGVHVGKKWYGHFEIGCGIQGFINVGFGYKFNSKNSKK